MVIKHWSIPFKRVNPSNLLDVNIINASSEGFTFSLESKQTSIDLDKIKSYWYRRGKIRFNITGIEKLQNEKLQEAIYKKEFKRYWQITKDQIEVCKDCEFRYICSDCRAFLNKKELFSKPKKCNYDPYTATWN